MLLNSKEIYKNIRDFRSGGWNMDIYDSPGSFWFRPIFYFDDDGLIGMSPDFVEEESKINEKLKGVKTIVDLREKWGGITYKNTAYDYLQLNGERDRAGILKWMVNRLYNLTFSTPWYFQELTGMGELIKQKNSVFTADEFKVPEMSITLKCMADSVDERIGTILDAYKTVCFNSYQMKEVVPVNLRRFNMGVFVFQNMSKNMNSRVEGINMNGGMEESIIKLSINGGSDVGSNYGLSYKYYELRDCEINLDMILASEMKQDEPSLMEYEIPIKVGRVMEHRVNSFEGLIISDFIKTDLGGVGSYVNEGKDWKRNEGDREKTQIRAVMFESKYQSSGIGEDGSINVSVDGSGERGGIDAETYVIMGGLEERKVGTKGLNRRSGGILSSAATAIKNTIPGFNKLKGTLKDKVNALDVKKITTKAINDGISYGLNELKETGMYKTVSNMAFGSLYYKNNVSRYLSAAENIMTGNINKAINNINGIKESKKKSSSNPVQGNFYYGTRSDAKPLTEYENYKKENVLNTEDRLWKEESGGYNYYHTDNDLKNQSFYRNL